MQLVISSSRYDAFMYASHVLSRDSDVIVLSDGFEEDKEFNVLCREALKVQHRHELDMSYSTFKVRKLYHFCMDNNDRDYERIITEVQLLALLGGYKRLYFYDDGDKLLFDIIKNIKRIPNKIIYSKNKYILGKFSVINKLSTPQRAKKEIAIERMVTLKDYLLERKTDVEFLQFF